MGRCEKPAASSAGPRVRQRLGREQLECGVVVDVALADDAAVTVIGVLAETHVGDEDEARGGPTDRAERARDDAARVGRAAAPRVLLLRDAEEQHRRDADVGQPPAFLGRAVDRALRHARHRLDRSLDAVARYDEERLDELLRDDAGLANETAERLAAAEPPRAIGGEAAHRYPSLTLMNILRSRSRAPFR